MSNQERKLAAIVYTDIAGFSELSAADEGRALELINLQREIVEPIVNNYNGNLHKEIGDGFLLTFPTVTAAVEFGIDFQRAVKKIDGLNIRIGIHEGEITEQNNDVFGDDVNIGARIEPHSPIGGIAISEKVKLEIGSLPEYQTQFIGEPELKGIKQPIKIYCISSHGLVSSFKITDDSVVVKDGGHLRFNVLSLTGIVLMILGGVFWAWYGFGGFTYGSGVDFDGGIKKSIAVFNFENLTGEKDGDFFCSGISEGLRSALTQFSKLNVKSRLASLNKNAEDIEVDYYVEGTLSKMGENSNITVSLVSAKSGSNLWNDQYEFVENEILAFQDTIINNVLTELNFDPSFTKFSSNESEYKNTETFKLLGEGIYHYDNDNYSDALISFDSVLELDPENVVANFHRANTHLKLDNYNEAMNIYQAILSQSDDIQQIDWSWTFPKRKGIPQTYCSNIAISEEMNMAVVLSRGRDGGRLFGFNIELNKIVWENPILDKLAEKPIIINNMIFLTSNRYEQGQAGEPTLYAYNILTGEPIWGIEFPRDNETHAMLVNIVRERGSFSNSNSTIPLVLNSTQKNIIGAQYKEIALIETTGGSVLWRKRVAIDVGMGGFLESMLIDRGEDKLLVLISDNDIITLNNKTGDKIWSKNFSSAGSLSIYFWNQKILVKNGDENSLTLWDPVSHKEEWEYYNENVMTSIGKSEGLRRMDNDVLLQNFVNGDLVAINIYGGLLNWSLERWTQKIGIIKKLWFKENAYNRIFCLTENDSLFTISLDSGKIINRFATENHDYRAYYDNSQNGMVLNNEEYLIGVDPISGDRLWKIKDNGVDKVRLINNALVTVKATISDESLIINIYNRDNGNLIGNEKIDIARSLNNWILSSSKCKKDACLLCGNFSISSLKYSDRSLLLLLHDEIIKFKPVLSENGMIQKKDVMFNIAKTYMENGQLEKAINEFNLLLSHYDQMNQRTYWELATIYQKNNNINDAVKTLLNYYDLMLPTSPDGIQTIQKLKDLSGLKWKKDMYWDRFDNVDMGADKEIIFLYLDNKIEAYRFNSGLMLWTTELGDHDSHIVLSEEIHKNHIFSIKAQQPNDDLFWENISESKTLNFQYYKNNMEFSLVSTNKRSGAILFDVPLDIPGLSDVRWMGINNNKIYIQSIINNDMSIMVYNIIGGDLLWKISRKVSDYYTKYDLTPAFYNDSLFLPLDTKIEYINSENGALYGQYSSDYIEQIVSFNEESIQDSVMIFFIDDISIEYVIVDMEENSEINIGDIELDNPMLGSWINNVFVDVSSNSAVTAFEFKSAENRELNSVWKESFHYPVSLLGFDKKYIYFLNKNNNSIVVVDLLSGQFIRSEPLLWPVINFELINNYFVVQSARKLYLISL